MNLDLGGAAGSGWAPQMLQDSDKGGDLSDTAPAPGLVLKVRLT